MYLFQPCQNDKLFLLKKPIFKFMGALNSPNEETVLKIRNEFEELTIATYKLVYKVSLAHA